MIRVNDLLVFLFKILFLNCVNCVVCKVKVVLETSNQTQYTCYVEIKDYFCS